MKVLIVHKNKLIRGQELVYHKLLTFFDITKSNVSRLPFPGIKKKHVRIYKVDTHQGFVKVVYIKRSYKGLQMSSFINPKNANSDIQSIYKDYRKQIWNKRKKIMKVAAFVGGTQMVLQLPSYLNRKELDRQCLAHLLDVSQYLQKNAEVPQEFWITRSGDNSDSKAIWNALTQFYKHDKDRFKQAVQQYVPYYACKDIGLGKKLGSGAFGAVYLTQDAKKVVKVQYNCTAYVAELKAFYQLHGAKITPEIYDSFICKGKLTTSYYFVMEKMQGTLLDYLWPKLTLSNGTLRLDYNTIKEVLYELIRLSVILIARKYAHYDVHNDNIMFKMENDKLRLYLIDFGLSNKLDTELDTPVYVNTKVFPSKTPTDMGRICFMLYHMHRGISSKWKNWKSWYNEWQTIVSVALGDSPEFQKFVQNLHDSAFVITYDDPTRVQNNSNAYIQFGTTVGIYDSMGMANRQAFLDKTPNEHRMNSEYINNSAKLAAEIKFLK